MYGPLPEMENQENQVHIPDDELPITPAELQTLRDNMDPLTSCDDYGISFYLYTRDYVKNIVSY